jgi:hypothetical protein
VGTEIATLCGRTASTCDALEQQCPSGQTCRLDLQTGNFGCKTHGTWDAGTSCQPLQTGLWQHPDGGSPGCPANGECFPVPGFGAVCL